MRDISRERWERAQEVEVHYWGSIAEDPVEFWRILHEKQEHLERVRATVPQAVAPPNGRTGRALEVGIGAYGIGVATLLEPAERWEIVGVDPQPPRRPNLSPVATHLYDVAQARLDRYVQAKAETLEEDDASFDLVFCYNVLDHTHDWRKVLSEIHRVLHLGGYFALGLDTLSLLKKVQWNTQFRVTRKHSPGFVAHPFRFSAWQMARALREAGFEVVHMQRDRWEAWKRLFSRSRRLLAIGRKPEDGGDGGRRE